MRWIIYGLIIFLASFVQDENQGDEVFIYGKTDIEVEFLTVGNDTISVVDGVFSDTLYRDKDEYNYLKTRISKKCLAKMIELNLSFLPDY